MRAVRSRVLVAGVGNIFFGDDGFGVEVARRLGAEHQHEGVRVADFGIRSVHLAYELLEGYDTLVLVDAMSRGEPPGTLFVVDPNLDDLGPHEEPTAEHAGTMVDAHTIHPTTVLRAAVALGARLGTVRVVGCEPAELGPRIGLSPAVEGAVDRAMALVRDLIRRAERTARTEPPEGEEAP
jgi:hydrogenase maturation protease